MKRRCQHSLHVNRSEGSSASRQQPPPAAGGGRHRGAGAAGCWASCSGQGWPWWIVPQTCWEGLGRCWTCCVPAEALMVDVPQHEQCLGTQLGPVRWVCPEHGGMLRGSSSNPSSLFSFPQPPFHVVVAAALLAWQRSQRWISPLATWLPGFCGGSERGPAGAAHGSQEHLSWCC